MIRIDPGVREELAVRWVSYVSYVSYVSWQSRQSWL